MNIEHNIVSVSGGKDSTALLLLAIERKTENLQAVFADTGHEHAQTYDYVEYLNAHVFPIRTIKADFSARIAAKAEFIAVKWREQGIPEEKVVRALAVMKPTGNPFLDLCIWKGRFPSTKARFCSEELKRNPIIEQVQHPLLSAGDDVVSWQGVRRDESANRRNLPERECKEIDNETGAELWNFRPILDWDVEDVFAMHRRHGILPNPLYTQGMGRVGCMPCIHARKDELLEIGLRFPEEIDRVMEWEKIVGEASKRDMATFFATAQLSGPQATSDSAEISLERHGVWQAIEWAKTSRGGRQYDMFRTLENDGPLCHLDLRTVRMTRTLRAFRALPFLRTDMTEDQIASIQYAADWLSRSEDIGNRKHGERLRALLSASIADTAGAKLMPPKMTPQMKSAFVKAAREYGERTGGNDPDAMYEAAFTAAPPAPSVADAAGARLNLQNVFNELREDFSVADAGKALKAVERAIAKESGK